MADQRWSPNAAVPTQARAIAAYRDRLQGELRGLVDALVDTVGNGHNFEAKRAALQSFLEQDMIPHALAEQDSTYVTGASVPTLARLVDGLVLEHRALVELADEIADGDQGLSVVAAAYALLALFEVHVEKENDLLLRGLIAAGQDPGRLLNTMHRALAARKKEARATMEATEEPRRAAVDTAGIAARIGEQVVDTRVDESSSCANLATSAVDALAAGGSFVLVADHDPRGIDYMLRAERPGATTWEVLEDGPARWQIRIAKTAAVA